MEVTSRTFGGELVLLAIEQKQLFKLSDLLGCKIDDGISDEAWTIEGFANENDAVTLSNGAQSRIFFIRSLKKGNLEVPSDRIEIIQALSSMHAEERQLRKRGSSTSCQLQPDYSPVQNFRSKLSNQFIWEALQQWRKRKQDKIETRAVNRTAQSIQNQNAQANAIPFYEAGEYRDHSQKRFSAQTARAHFFNLGNRRRKKRWRSRLRMPFDIVP
tara:strand:- start:1618 stop:2262 length:645 start_codon:yes stop_codon:yes gene_type:complete